MNSRSFLAVGVLLALLTRTALAATYSVTNNGDTATGGTLRWALDAGATNPGPDTVQFNLPGSTTITPTGHLPGLSDLFGGTLVDGTTQPGYTGAPLVRVVGTSAGSSPGLFINGGSNEVRGLVITRFNLDGVQVLGAYNRISGCQVVSNNGIGVYIGGRYNTIGGTNAADRNVISGNHNDGVTISGSDAVMNAVLGNYIGTDPTGLLGNSNYWTGVAVAAPSNRIGSAGGGRNVISGNGTYGINLYSDWSHHNIVEGNYCGVGADGSTARPNISGIQLSGASNNTIGGSTPGAGNVFSGNINYGVSFQPGCHSNTVVGNFIGTDATGSSVASNFYDGISVSTDCGGNQIGGADATGRNIISGNGYRGIALDSVTGLVIRGNAIGVSSSGASLGNGMEGIWMWHCSQVAVGGTNVDARNVIAGNAVGIRIDGGVSNTVRFNYIGLNEAGVAVGNGGEGILGVGGGSQEVSDNVVSGNGTYGIRLSGTAGWLFKRNLIGTDPAGTADRGNSYIGLYLHGGASNTVVGGRWADEGNVISGNDLGGVQLEELATRNNILRGNRIGASLSGMTAVPNQYSGIALAHAPLNTIGSSTNTQERNVISGNSGQGVDVGFSNSFGNVIAGNCIGTDASVTNRLANTGAGIWIHQASSNLVGGAEIGALNCIAYNGGSGIQVESGDGNLLLNNSIYRNGSLGIDLGLGTPTPNDPLDADAGPNRQQNYPVLVSVSNDGTQIRVVWTLDSGPSQPCVLEFYGSTGPDPTTYGEGEYPMGWVGPVTTTPAGVLGGTNLLATPTLPPNFITVLATHATLLDTSEFSPRILLDSDGDGMGDGYEARYFGGHTNGQPDVHADSDGLSNLAEFVADTNPLDAGSVPRVKSASLSGSSLVLTAPCSLERSYQVQICTNLTATPQSWPPRSATLTYSGADGVFTVQGATSASYRITSSLP